MGIPSFYRHLLRTYPKLVGRGVGPRPEWLCLDFNCAMYGVLRRMPPLEEGGSQAAWEEKFCAAIADYMGELVRLANPTKGAYVSCDGVVCAAKRRQQRLRRFKGPWQAAAEAEARGSAGGPPVPTDRCATWDQNALTPGSAFMARLGVVLTGAGARLSSQIGIPVQVSTTSEPGEGEHKLLRAMRAVRPASCTIYGLDADLILLSMLLEADTGADVRLMREAQEFEARRVDRDAPAEWRNLTIRGLTRALLPTGSDAAAVRDYVAAMSLLGNDFLPRSLTRTVRDDGIPQLIDGLRTVWSAGQHVVEPASGALSRAGLLMLVSQWAATEEDDMRAAVVAAERAAERGPARGTSPAETALKEWQGQPARWCSIKQLFTSPDWRAWYRQGWQAGDAAGYLAGVAWTWDYYAGRPVDQGWCYDAHLPPLWCDVAAVLRGGAGPVSAPAVQWADALPEWVHLLSVLPTESVQRLLPARAQELMKETPWWWPTEWSLFDVGRQQMWECEPVIPVIPESVLRIWGSLPS